MILAPASMKNIIVQNLLQNKENFFNGLLSPTFQTNLGRGGTTFKGFDAAAKVRQYSPGNDIQLPWGATSNLQVFLSTEEKVFAPSSNPHSQNRAHIWCLMWGTAILAPYIQAGRC